MSVTQAIAIGVACGLLGSLPAAVPFEAALKKGRNPGVSVGTGLASVVVSFLGMTLATLAFHLASGGKTLVFGCAMVLTFLAFWGAESIRGWRAARKGAPAEGKDE